MPRTKNTIRRIGSMLIVLVFFASPAMAQDVCGERFKFLRHLSKIYSEVPSALGVTNNGQVLELLRSKKGSWTILVTSAQGKTCMMSAGDAWEEVKLVALEEYF